MKTVFRSQSPARTGFQRTRMIQHENRVGPEPRLTAPNARSAAPSNDSPRAQCAPPRRSRSLPQPCHDHQRHRQLRKADPRANRRAQLQISHSHATEPADDSDRTHRQPDPFHALANPAIPCHPALKTNPATRNGNTRRFGMRRVRTSQTAATSTRLAVAHQTTEFMALCYRFERYTA